MWSRFIVLLIAVAALPAAAGANVVWPAALLTARLLAWWIIGASLIIEALFVRAAFRLPFWKTVWATLAANAISRHSARGVASKLWYRLQDRLGCLQPGGVDRHVRGSGRLQFGD
jgi:hypothetical protein